MMRRMQHCALSSVSMVILALALGGCIGTGSNPAVSNLIADPHLSGPNGESAPPQRTEPIDPATLVGLRAGAVQAKLGDPSLLRRDGTAQIWQYRGPGCIVDLFLYRRGEEDAQVAFVDMRGPQVDEGKGPACVGAMAAPGQQAALSRS